MNRCIEHSFNIHVVMYSIYEMGPFSSSIVKARSLFLQSDGKMTKVEDEIYWMQCKILCIVSL